jgi:hypothetical protein
LKYLYAENHVEHENQTFRILPVGLNNYFREASYATIKEGDAVLIKEFEVEYRKDVP